MRKAGIRLMEILHGFFIFSVLYCAIYVQLTDQLLPVFERSLLFLLVILICSLSVDKGVKFYLYVLISVAMCIGVFFTMRTLTGSVFHSVLMVVLALVIIGNYFFAKATDKKCWIENPIYPALFYYILVCFYANYFHSDFLVKFVCLAAGCHFLMVNVHSNYVHMGLFMRDYEKLERLPVSRMNRNNRRMMWIQSVIVSLVMIVAPYLKLDAIIRNLGILFRKILVWILTHIGQEPVEEEMEQMIPQQSAPFKVEAIANEENLFFKILDVLMEILGWVIILGLLFLLLRFLIKKFLEMYNQFNIRTEDNGDVVENLIADSQTIDRAYQVREKRENLFMNWSPDARIRKHYKKRILKDHTEEIRKSWTPEQLEEAVTLQGEKKERFHVLYEKARYAQESCSREEAQEMTEL